MGMSKKIYLFVAVVIATLSTNLSQAQDDYQKKLEAMSNSRFLGELALQVENICVKGSNPQDAAKCAQKRAQWQDVENDLGRREANFALPGSSNPTVRVKPEDLIVGTDEFGNCLNKNGEIVAASVGSTLF